MLYFTQDKSDCTGCGACVAACPFGCAAMEKDAEGFWYPVATDACVRCGKCERACPLVDARLNADLDYPQRAFCALTKDKNVWLRSASGGAFSEICRAFGDENTIFCGAAWDGLRVRHVCVQGVDKIAPLCKSKYVASSTENTFVEIKSFLEEGRKVVFCGTPCQVAGLKSALGRDYERLLTIDLICHGVGSPSVFAACVDAIGRQFGRRVVSYEFRAKKSVFAADHIQKIGAADRSRVYLTDDPYIQLFLSQKCLRPSCGKHCRFRNQNRQGDLTIADFKGLTQVFPQLRGTKRNYSTIIVNSEKGNAVIPKLRKTMETLECGLEDVKKYNPLFYRQTWFCEERDAFFAEFLRSPQDAIEKATVPAKICRKRWKRKLFDALPVSLRRWTLIWLKRGGGE